MNPNGSAEPGAARAAVRVRPGGAAYPPAGAGAVGGGGRRGRWRGRGGGLGRRRGRRGGGEPLRPGDNRRRAAGSPGGSTAPPAVHLARGLGDEQALLRRLHVHERPDDRFVARRIARTARAGSSRPGAPGGDRSRTRSSARDARSPRSSARSVWRSSPSPACGRGRGEGARPRRRAAPPARARPADRRGAAGCAPAPAAGGRRDGGTARRRGGRLRRRAPPSAAASRRAPPRIHASTRWYCAPAAGHGAPPACMRGAGDLAEQHARLRIARRSRSGR